MNSSGDSKGIGLTELIAQVKKELLQPPADDEADLPLLAVEEVELEISVTVSKKAEGGLDIHVLHLGADVGRDDVHRVNIKLAPLLSHEERVAALRQDPRWAKIWDQQWVGTVKGSPGEETPDRY